MFWGYFNFVPNELISYNNSSRRYHTYIIINASYEGIGVELE